MICYTKNMKINKFFKHSNHYSFSINEMSILFGLSIGNPKARAQIPLERTPIALDTPKTTV